LDPFLLPRIFFTLIYLPQCTQNEFEVNLTIADEAKNRYDNKWSCDISISSYYNLEQVYIEPSQTIASLYGVVIAAYVVTLRQP
jgi:hypothetical protein